MVDDQITQERAAAGIEPDCIGWIKISEVLNVDEKTARLYERAGLPVVSWGRRHVAAYADRLRAWAMLRARARPRRDPVGQLALPLFGVRAA